MLWAPFPVRTYWLPHTRPAPKWIVHNSFNRSPPETTGKRPFLSETSSMPANSKPRELQGLPAAAPPPSCPPPSCPPPRPGSGSPRPACQRTLCTVQIEGQEDSRHWLPSPPRGWKSSPQEVTLIIPLVSRPAQRTGRPAQDASDLSVLSEVPKAARIQGLEVSYPD